MADPEKAGLDPMAKTTPEEVRPQARNKIGYRRGSERKTLMVWTAIVIAALCIAFLVLGDW